MSAEEAADPLYGLLSPELYLVFAHERERWERWVGQSLRAQLRSSWARLSPVRATRECPPHGDDAKPANP